jgi:hypothetical protein
VRETVRDPLGIVKVSPAVYELPVIEPLNKKFPVVALSHAVKNVASSEPAMFVHETFASEVSPPPVAAPNETD